jgi:putative tryptophan/tyrosine transport system substrate-binding protein
MMRRRDFIAGLGSAAAWPMVLRAQQSAVPVIGHLNSESLETWVREWFAAFHRGLNEAGFVEGRNVIIDYRWAEGRNDRLAELAADLVRRQVSVIAASGTPATVAAKAATKVIPTVFLVGSDPVLSGLVASLNRPGGQLTGVAILNTEIITKRLELLLELVPSTTVIAFLVNPTNSVFTEAELTEIQPAARVRGVRLLVLNASSASELEAAFATLTEQRAGGLLVSGDNYFQSRRDQLLALSARHGVPTIYVYHEFSAIGGLISYGPNVSDAFRLEGTYVGRILKGEKPADLPVQESTKIELVINMKTAKALGLTVPQSILLRADEVIE